MRQRLTTRLVASENHEVRRLPQWLVLAVALWCATSFVAAADEYEMGAGDTIHLVVLDQPALSGDFKLDGDGMISVPFLDKFKLSGMTVAEAERKVKELLLLGRILKQPRVSLSIKEYGSQSVLLAGEFPKTGLFALGADRSLLALVNAVGSLTPNAGHEIFVVRPPALGQGGIAPLAEPASPSPSGQTAPLPGEVAGAEVFRINLRELQSGIAERNILLQAKDTVYLPKAAQVYVFGQVARPGAYRYEEGITVYQALLQAGGVTNRGSSKGIRIVRLVDGKTQEFKPQLTDVLAPGDTLRVPERFF